MQVTVRFALLKIIWCASTATGIALADESRAMIPVVRSVGCGLPEAANGQFVELAMRVLNQERTYYLRVPKTYDSDHPYPLIFRWHGYGGNGLSGGLDIQRYSKDRAIIVGPNGLHEEWSERTRAADLAFFDQMLATIEAKYCIDRDRVFSYGFSQGAFFTNLLACVRGDVVRGIATVAGGPRGSDCEGNVASWFLNDVDDAVVPISEGIAARNRALALNSCSVAGPVPQGSSCVRYRGCKNAPVVWCESTGVGHDIQSNFAPSRVWQFFRSLR